MAGRSSRSARGDGRADGVALALALLISIVALALSDSASDRVAASLRRTVFAPIASLQQRAERARSALISHDSAARARDSLALQATDAVRLAAENERLRQTLGLAARLQTGFVPVEALHGPALGEEHTILLSGGTNVGITKFSAVVAPEGIIGYVRSVDATSSVAIVWPHPDFRVSAMAADGSSVGIVSAHLGEGASRFLLELRGVPFRSPLKPGTLIISAGIGGTFPAGIPVGTVIRQLSSAEGWERNYLLLPAVHPADVTTMMVLLPGRTATNLRSVWTNADSAVVAGKRAVAAGDSLARAARQRDSIVQAARQRDSLARVARTDTVRRAP